MFTYLIIIILSFGAVLAWFIGSYFFNIALTRDSKWFESGGHTLLNPDIQAVQPEHITKEYDMQKELGSTFYDDPTHETKIIKSKDGLTLKAKIMHVHPTKHKWVLLVHGYRSSGKRDMSYIGSRLADAGFNVMIPDHRAHGDSDGSYIGMGYPEHLDMLQWLSEINKIDSKAQILIYGGSMGAATVMMTIGDNTLPENVVAAIADCGYTGAKEEFSYILKEKMKLPVHPILDFANIVTKIKTGTSLYSSSSTRFLSNNALPTLFIHGTADDFVPFYMLDTNIKATAGPYDVLVVEGATHFFSHVHAPQEYFDKIFSFIDKNM